MQSEHDETTTESVDSDPESDNEENKSNTKDNNSEMEENVSKSDTKTLFEKYTFCKLCNENFAQNSNIKITLRTYIQTVIKRGKFQTLMMNDRTKP